MIVLAEFLTIILIIIIVLLQAIDLEIVYRDHLHLKISSTIFSVELSKMINCKRKRKQKLTNQLYTFLFITKAASLLLSRSVVHVRAYKPFDASVTSHNGRMIGSSIISPLFLSNLKNNAAAYTESNNASERLNLLFTFSLLALFISLAKASYYVLKSKIKRWS